MATFVLTVGQTWGMPHVSEVAATVTAVGTLVGALIGVSQLRGPSGGGPEGTGSRRALACLALALACALGSAVPAQALVQRTEVVSAGHGRLNPSYLVVHSTANPGATAENHVTYWRRNQPSVVMAHYVMDWTGGGTVIQTQETDRLAWHVGNGNSRTYGIELCEATNPQDFEVEWRAAVEWAAMQLRSRGWGTDRLICHADASEWWGGTHTDPTGYFARFGRSWGQFKADVAAYMAGGTTSQGDRESTGSTDESGNQTQSGYTAHEGTGFGGTYSSTVSGLRTRRAPGLGGAQVGSCVKGERLPLDDWYVVLDGYVWGRFTAFDGAKRYVAVGRATGRAESDDYLVRAATTATVSSSGFAGTYRTIVRSVRTRRGPGLGYRVVGSCVRGERVYLTSYRVADGYVWGSFRAWDGTTRWVAVGPATGKASAATDYLVK